MLPIVLSRDRMPQTNGRGVPIFAPFFSHNGLLYESLTRGLHH
jgi:hypothetical protein